MIAIAGIENLRTPTSDEAREIGAKGGRNSGIKRGARKLWAEDMQELLRIPMDNKKIAEIEEMQSLKSFKGQNITVQTAILVKLTQKAMAGDMKAIELILKIIGQDPSLTKKISASDLARNGGAMPKSLIDGIDDDEL